MAANHFANFDNMDYYHDPMTTYRDQMLETGENLGLDETAVDNALETNFENSDPCLKLNYALRKIHILMLYYLEEMRRTNGIGNNRQHLFGIRNMLNLYYDTIPREFYNNVSQWTQYRLDRFHYDDTH